MNSERSYTEESESLHSGSDNATAVALQLEKERLEELKEKFDENEKAISNLKQLREQQDETNPETDENNDMHYNKLENQMLTKRSESSKALEERTWNEPQSSTAQRCCRVGVSRELRTRKGGEPGGGRSWAAGEV